MGKYEFYKEDPFAKNEILTAIANELAESNRLKRLELSFKQITNVDGARVYALKRDDLLDNA